MNKNYNSLGEYIQRNFMEGGSITRKDNGSTGKDKPCIWCCEKLDIMDEMELWVKHKFANECNFEEFGSSPNKGRTQPKDLDFHLSFIRLFSAMTEAKLFSL